MRRAAYPAREPDGLEASPRRNPLVQNLSRKEIPSLFGLRGLAAIAVVLFHYASRRGIMALFPGPYAVTLFFELSGLLITWLLLKEIDQNGSIDRRQFYLRRALRLFPVFYFVWIFCRLHGSFPGSWATFFYMGDYYYAFRQNYGPMTVAWSLGVEEKFYLLWPFLLARIERTRLVKIIIAVLIAEPIYRSIISALGHAPYTWFAFDCHLDAILLGCLIAIMAKRGWNPPSWLSHPWTPACALVLVFALQSQNDIVTYLLGVILVSTVCHPSRLLNNPVLRYLGLISYSLYLCHGYSLDYLWPILGGRYLHSAPITFVAKLALAIASASVLHFTVERPLLRLKDRFHRRPQPMATLQRAARS
ncbi:MAG TPA: acyltransferase [Candidatus Acidoferrales bacterium]|nr:acyltransferase [Candidatus Acidoferrales bacterium]